MTPKLRELEGELVRKRWKPEKIEALGIPELIIEIEADADPAELRPLAATTR